MNSENSKAAEVKPFTPGQEKFAKAMIKWVAGMQTWVYRKSGGKMWKNFIGGYPIMLLTATGRKSGVKRTIPLIHVPHGDNELLVASQGGMSTSPNWYFNIVAHPEVEIYHAGVSRTMIARQVSDEEKASLWPHLCSVYPDYDEYQRRTDRNIPVFVCEEAPAAN